MSTSILSASLVLVCLFAGFGTSCSEDGEEPLIQILKMRGHVVTLSSEKPGASAVAVGIGDLKGPKIKSMNAIALKLPSLKELKTIYIITTDLTDDGLADFSSLQKLEHLWIEFSSITDASIKEIAKCKNLRKLELGHAKITGSGLQFLSGLKHLTYLDLSYNPVVDDSLAKIVAPQLKGLILTKTKITDKALASVAKFRLLEVLSVRDTGITDTGIKQLAGLRDLEFLDISSTAVTDAGLLELTSLSKLKKISAFNTKITKNGLNEFLKSVPNCDLIGISD